MGVVDWRVVSPTLAKDLDAGCQFEIGERQ